jgi:RHS repeat-associated protein
MVYLPFGEISQPNSWGNDTVTSKFTGQEYDAETGLYNFGARYYDPAIGRFVSADNIVPSVTDSQSFNRYTYARDNPIIYTDPTGHSFWSTVSAIYNAIGNAIRSAMRGLAHAVSWVANRLVDAGKFLINGCKFAFQIAKSMVIAATQNPMAALGLLLAVAAGPPGWVGLTVAIAAQGMAMAAGINDPLVLALIGAVAGAAGVGVTAMLMAGAKFGIERALVSAGVSPALVAVGAIMVNIAVNQLTQDPEPDSAEASIDDSADSTSSDPLLADNSDTGSSNGTATDAPAHDYYGSEQGASGGAGGAVPPESRLVAFVNVAKSTAAKMYRYFSENEGNRNKLIVAASFVTLGFDVMMHSGLAGPLAPYFFVAGAVILTVGAIYTGYLAGCAYDNRPSWPRKRKRRRKSWMPDVSDGNDDLFNVGMRGCPA